MRSVPPECFKFLLLGVFIYCLNKVGIPGNISENTEKKVFHFYLSCATIYIHYY